MLTDTKPPKQQKMPSPLSFCTPPPFPPRPLVPSASPLKPPPQTMHLTHPPPSDPLTKTLHQLHLSPIILCIRFSDPDQALQAAQAALRGGLNSIEITLTTPSAIPLIRHLTRCHPHALIGAGTVLTPLQLTQAHAAGARFCLSPVCEPGLVVQGERLGMLYVPGGGTATEIYRAYEAGARVVKVFPVDSCGGLEFVKAMGGPLGHIPLLPTSGVDKESLARYMALGNVYAVGASRQILCKEAVGRGDWDVVTERAREWVAIVNKVRHGVQQ